MKNLIGCEDSDAQIIRELKAAKIEIVRVSGITGGEPVSLLIGKLGTIIFDRGCAAWYVKVNVPLDVVKEIYEDPASKEGLSIGGGPPGELWDSSLSYIDGQGKTLIARSQMHCKPNTEAWKMIENNPRCRIVEDPTVEGKPFFTDFRILDEMALRLFVDVLKKYKLV